MTKDSKVDTSIYDFQIRVLISREEHDYEAHALEMDLVACGKSEKAALQQLENLVFNQISFAIERGEEHLMVFPAPKEYFARWETAHTDALKSIAREKTTKMRVKALSICFTEKDVKRLARSRLFELAPVHVCA